MTDLQGKITGFWSAVADGYEAHPGNVPARGSQEFGCKRGVEITLDWPGSESGTERQ